ncbi:HVO_A0114 family putative DNA-binding protein [Rathayibacter soli]|uniref:HVO_A0114 family putative DNA-binding protein n=1 Tax=Rathayibacter soli TaxID=3144168 RepID=UPI0027E43E45|nr:hypothetical protein [Glaciibacter superstes]
MNVQIAVNSLPIFKSELQARLLFELLTTSEPRTEADLARLLERPQPSVHRELSRLIDSGYLRFEAVGRAKLITADDGNPAIPPLRALVSVTLGPAQLLRKQLPSVRGIRHALIFGSFAARAERVAGQSPADIDLLIVGDVDRAAVYSITSAVESVVRREINITFTSSARWQDSTEPFLQNIRSNPTITLLNHDDSRDALATPAGRDRLTPS